MYAHINGMALAIVAKVGTQSFREAEAHWYVTNEEALIYPERIFFIREPFLRLVSAYSFFKGLERAGTRYEALPLSAITDWETFVDYILLNEDEHWMPQTDTTLYTGDGVFVPTKIMRFEDVTKWWPLFSSKRLPHENQSVPQEVDIMYRRAEVDAFYSNDYAIYKDLSAYDDLAEKDRGWPIRQEVSR